MSGRWCLIKLPRDTSAPKFGNLARIKPLSILFTFIACIREHLGQDSVQTSKTRCEFAPCKVARSKLVILNAGVTSHIDIQLTSLAVLLFNR